AARAHARRAESRPIPLAPPVTIATLPVKKPRVSLLVSARCRAGRAAVTLVARDRCFAGHQRGAAPTPDAVHVPQPRPAHPCELGLDRSEPIFRIAVGAPDRAIEAPLQRLPRALGRPSGCD